MNGEVESRDHATEGQSQKVGEARESLLQGPAPPTAAFLLQSRLRPDTLNNAHVPFHPPFGGVATPAGQGAQRRRLVSRNNRVPSFRFTPTICPTITWSLDQTAYIWPSFDVPSLHHSIFLPPVGFTSLSIKLTYDSFNSYFNTFSILYLSTFIIFTTCLTTSANFLLCNFRHSWQLCQPSSFFLPSWARSPSRRRTWR